MKMTLEAGKEMDRRCVINWLLEVYRHPNVAFHAHSDEQQREYAHDALVLLNDCHNCKFECLSQKYDELKEKYDALLKEQEAVKPVLDEQTGRIWLCGKCGSYVGFEDNDPHDPNEYGKYCRECGRPVLWESR